MHVAFVAQDHFLDVLVGVLVDVPQPFDDVLEALFVRYVVDEHDAHGAAIVRRGDCVETLLACPTMGYTNTNSHTLATSKMKRKRGSSRRCRKTAHTSCVPDLQLDLLAPQLDCFDLKIDAYRRDERRGVCIVGETEQNARFADTRIADQQQFEQ